jgi:hypothetical protein
MRTIKTYKLFIEEVESDPSLTDEPDIKMAKEQLTATKNQLAEYKSKKTLIDNAYLKIKLDADLKLKIDEIVGKTDDKTPKNPFIVEYLHIANLKRRLDKLQGDITNDKIKKDDFGTELGLSKDDSVKQAVNAKITDITNRISTNTANIASLVKDLADAQKALDNKMINIEKNMMDNIKKLSTQTSK